MLWRDRKDHRVDSGRTKDGVEIRDLSKKGGFPRAKRHGGVEGVGLVRTMSRTGVRKVKTVYP